MKVKDKPNEFTGKPNDDSLDLNYFEKKFSNLSDQVKSTQKSIAHLRRDTSADRSWRRQSNEVKKE